MRYKESVPALLPKIDGLSFILFHVEHSAGERWHYRWRIVGDYPAPYLVWRDETTDQPWQKVGCEIPACTIECEWRAAPSQPWRQVALLALTPAARARFAVHAEREFAAPEPFSVVAPVRDDGVAAYLFPAMHLLPGVTAQATARADAPAVANLLFAPGEFVARGLGLVITNLGASADAYTVHPHAGPFTLTRCPLAAARRWFAVGSAAVDPALLA